MGTLLSFERGRRGPPRVVSRDARATRAAALRPRRLATPPRRVRVSSRVSLESRRLSPPLIPRCHAACAALVSPPVLAPPPPPPPFAQRDVGVLVDRGDVRDRAARELGLGARRDHRWHTTVTLTCLGPRALRGTASSQQQVLGAIIAVLLLVGALVSPLVARASELVGARYGDAHAGHALLCGGIGWMALWTTVAPLVVHAPPHVPIAFCFAALWGVGMAFYYSLGQATCVRRRAIRGRGGGKKTHETTSRTTCNSSMLRLAPPTVTSLTRAAASSRSLYTARARGRACAPPPASHLRSALARSTVAVFDDPFLQRHRSSSSAASAGAGGGICGWPATSSSSRAGTRRSTRASAASRAARSRGRRRPVTYALCTRLSSGCGGSVKSAHVAA